MWKEKMLLYFLYFCFQFAMIFYIKCFVNEVVSKCSVFVVRLNRSKLQHLWRIVLSVEKWCKFYFRKDQALLDTIHISFIKNLLSICQLKLSIVHGFIMFPVYMNELQLINCASFNLHLLFCEILQQWCLCLNGCVSACKLAFVLTNIL